jgi:hypothetical protein
MKLFSMHSLFLVIYAMGLGLVAWFERELFLIVPGILPVLLFTLIRSLDNWFEKSERSWTTTI